MQDLGEPALGEGAFALLIDAGERLQGDAVRIAKPEILTADRMGDRPRRATLIEDDDLGIGVTKELRCQQASKVDLPAPVGPTIMVWPTSPVCRFR